MTSKQGNKANNGSKASASPFTTKGSDKTVKGPSKATKKKPSPTILERIFKLVGSLIQISVYIMLAGFLLNWGFLQYENRTLLKTPVGDFVKVGEDGRQVNYLCLGNVEAPRTVLIVTGASANYLTYTSFMQRLVDKYPNVRACSYARSGHLWSEGVNTTTVEGVTSDLKEIVTQVSKTKNVTLIGHSMGGILSTHFTLQNPGLVEHLVLVDSVPTTITNDSVIFHGLKRIFQFIDVFSTVGAVRIASVFKPHQLLYPLVKEEYQPYHTNVVCKSRKPIAHSELDLAVSLAEVVSKQLEENPTPLSIPVKILLSETFSRNVPDWNTEWTEFWKSDTKIPKISPHAEIKTVPGSDHLNDIWTEMTLDSINK